MLNSCDPIELSDADSNLVLFPLVTESVLQMLLVRRFFPTALGGVCARSFAVGENGQLLSLPQHTCLLPPQCSVCVDEVHNLRAVSHEHWKRASRVTYNVVPHVKCIQCRQEALFSSPENDVLATATEGQAAPRVPGKLLLWMIFSVFLLVTVFATLCVQKWLTFSVLGIFALLLPFSSFVFQIVSMFAAAPVLYVWPEFYQELRSYVYDIRHITLQSDDAVLS